MSSGMKRLRSDSESSCIEYDGFTVKIFSPRSSVYVSTGGGLGAWAKNLNKQRSDGCLCDVVLVSEDGVRQHVHRCVLAASSAYFERMFQQKGFSESDKQEVKLNGVEGEALIRVLEFIYTGSLELTTENVHSVVKAADYILLSDMRVLCAHFMSAVLRSDFAAYEAVQIMQTATYLHFDKLKNDAWDTIYSNLKEVAKSKHFKELSLQEVVHMLSNDSHWSNEENVWWATVTWLEYNEERKIHLEEVMKCVRFPLISLKVLVNGVQPHVLVQESDFLKGLLEEALKYHADPLRRSLMQTPRTKPRGELHDGVFCLVGNESFYVYMPENKIWYSLASPLPVKLSNSTSVSFRVHSTFSFKLFFAQYQLHAVGVVKSVEARQYTVRSLQVYDEKQNTWTEKPLPSRCENTIFVSLGMALYACSENAVEILFPNCDSWIMVCKYNFAAYDFVCVGEGYLRFYDISSYMTNMITVDLRIQKRPVRIQKFNRPGWLNNNIIQGIYGIAQLEREDFILTYERKDPGDPKHRYSLIKMTLREITNGHNKKWRDWEKESYVQGLHPKLIWHVATSQKGVWVMASHPSVMERTGTGRDVFSTVNDGVIPFFKVDDGSWERLPSIPEQGNKSVSLCGRYEAGTVAACRYL